ESHIEQLFGLTLLGSETISAKKVPQPMVKPRLRVEPCPSYFLRTARAYAFLANFLEAAVGKEALMEIDGMYQDMGVIVSGSGRSFRHVIERAGKKFDLNLHDELQFQRELFYGL